MGGPSEGIRVGVLTDAERLKLMLCESLRSPGLNPRSTFALLARLLDTEFSGEVEETSRRFFDFVRAPQPQGMGLQPKDLLAIVNDLHHPQEVAPYLDKSVKDQMNRMRKRVSELVAAMFPLLTHEEHDAAKKPLPVGTNQHTQGPDKTENVRPSAYGNSKEYRLGVLKRDHQDIAERYASGEFRNVSEAERAAGIREPKATVKRTLAQQAIASFKKLRPEQRRPVYLEIRRLMVDVTQQPRKRTVKRKRKSTRA